jgi:membrane-bound metal-dependent hydrolase YbcI (DUF457 family)
MFIGHFAVGYGLKKAVPKASLGTLLAAPLLLDLLWPICLLLGLESVKIDPGNTVVTPLDLHDYPYTHSLAMALVWSALFGGGFAWRTGNRRGGAWIAAGVFSHWVFDWITHRPDMPLYPGSTTYVGLGLWNSLPGTLVVEFGLYAIGVWTYATTTRAKDRTGSIAWWVAAAFFAVMYVATVFGPPPPSAHIIAVGGVFMWLFPLLFAWIDRHRRVV